MIRIPVMLDRLSRSIAAVQYARADEFRNLEIGSSCGANPPRAFASSARISKRKIGIGQEGQFHVFFRQDG
jgi:hypothetical protein